MPAKKKTTAKKTAAKKTAAKKTATKKTTAKKKPAPKTIRGVPADIVEVAERTARRDARRQRKRVAEAKEELAEMREDDGVYPEPTEGPVEPEEILAELTERSDPAIVLDERVRALREDFTPDREDRPPVPFDRPLDRE